MVMFSFLLFAINNYHKGQFGDIDLRRNYYLVRRAKKELKTVSLDFFFFSLIIEILS